MYGRPLLPFLSYFIRFAPLFSDSLLCILEVALTHSESGFCWSFYLVFE